MAGLSNKMVDGEKLSEFAKKLKSNIKSDLLGNKKLRYVTQSDYDALTDAQKNDETVVYNIIDADIGPQVVMLTQEEYNDLDTIDPNILYVIN